MAGFGLISVELDEGVELPPLQIVVMQANINKYADASGDHNPIHIDQEFASKTPAKGTIAHGMLVLAYISQVLTSAFGVSWVSAGKIDVRFKTPARPGDTLSISGKIIRIENSDGRKIVHCDITCTNQGDEVVVLGNVEVNIGDNQDCS